MWTAKLNGDFVTLTYGSLDPDKSPLLMIACFNSMGIAVLNVHADLPEMKLGTPLTIEFASDGMTAPVDGRGRTRRARRPHLWRGDRHRA